MKKCNTRRSMVEYALALKSGVHPAVVHSPHFLNESPFQPKIVKTVNHEFNFKVDLIGAIVL